ncbi:MAG: hypothetical protein ACTSX1_09285 [Candidatus Heimdallarchaeaceae archaeon]
MSESEDQVKEYTIEDLKESVKLLIFPGEFDEFVHTIKEFTTKGEQIVEYVLYTSEYKYKLFAIQRDKGTSYLSCQVSSRKPRAGEDWDRGNDLRDGPLEMETWNQITRDMINYEIVRLSPYRKPNTRPDRR